MSHKRSITVEIDGKHYNVNTVSAGHKRMSEKEAVDRAVETKTLGHGFASMMEAVKRAEAKSRVLGRKFPHK